MIFVKSCSKREGFFILYSNSIRIFSRIFEYLVFEYWKSKKVVFESQPYLWYCTTRHAEYPLGEQRPADSWCQKMHIKPYVRGTMNVPDQDLIRILYITHTIGSTKTWLCNFVAEGSAACARREKNNFSVKRTQVSNASRHYSCRFRSMHLHLFIQQRRIWIMLSRWTQNMGDTKTFNK